MTLRNRCDPLSALHAVPARGAWMGNRGCLHNAGGAIRRGHQVKRWITCATAFKGRKRTLMHPGHYTELFFLDEATAYAAGHRPCAECRRDDWLRFKALWEGVFDPAKADDIDRILHDARLDGKARRLVPVSAAAVPVGAMIESDGAILLRADRGWQEWGFEGYRPATPGGAVLLITPEPIAALMALGLPVQMGTLMG